MKNHQHAPPVESDSKPAHDEVAKVAYTISQQEGHALGLAVPLVVDLDHESIWISYCPMALERFEPQHLGLFNSHHRLATPVSPWEKLKIGGGTPPVLTRHGWLIVYHGVRELPENLPTGAPADGEGPKIGGEK